LYVWTYHLCYIVDYVEEMLLKLCGTLYFWSYFILRFFVGGVSQSRRFGSPSAIFFCFFTLLSRHVSFTQCHFAVIVSSLREKSYLHYEAQFCAPIQRKIVGSFVKKSYTRNMEFKIGRLPRKSGGLAGLPIRQPCDFERHFDFVLLQLANTLNSQFKYREGGWHSLLKRLKCWRKSCAKFDSLLN